MPTQDFIVLTLAQKNAAEALNDGNAAVAGRLCDHPLITARVGININGLASGIAAGAVVALGNRYLIPLRVANDPAWDRWDSMLSGLPWCTLDSDTCFAPPPAD